MYAEGRRYEDDFTFEAAEESGEFLDIRERATAEFDETEDESLVEKKEEPVTIEGALEKNFGGNDWETPPPPTNVTIIQQKLTSNGIMEGDRSVRDMIAQDQSPNMTPENRAKQLADLERMTTSLLRNPNEPYTISESKIKTSQGDILTVTFAYVQNNNVMYDTRRIPLTAEHKGLQGSVGVEPMHQNVDVQSGKENSQERYEMQQNQAVLYAEAKNDNEAFSMTETDRGIEDHIVGRASTLEVGKKTATDMSTALEDDTQSDTSTTPHQPRLPTLNGITLRLAA